MTSPHPDRAGDGQGAVLSDCGRYRYALWRDTGRLGAEGTVLFVMLNPSTADAIEDDPTIRRCIGFAQRWGYQRLAVGNLFAYRATDPRDLADSLPTIHIVGELGEWRYGQREQINDTHLRQMADKAHLVVAAWGATKMPPGWENRPAQVAELLAPLHALGTTKAGHPRHPLYVKGDVCARPFPTPERPYP